MSYLAMEILVFLLFAALLGFFIGWLLRGSRFQNELKDLDARWRSKLSEIESERDRFVGDVTQANEARAKFEASAAEAQRLAETHEASLEQLRREHQAKLSQLADVEKRVGKLEDDLSSRDKELAEAKSSLTGQQTPGVDSERLNRELAAATARAKGLERDLEQAVDANSTCKREVERLEARIAELQRTATNADGGGGALGLVGTTSSSTGGGATGSAGSAAGSEDSGGSALGLVGGSDAEQSEVRSGDGTAGGSGFGGQSGQGSDQKAAAPPYLAETGGQSFVSSPTAASSSGEQSEGARPEALSAARGGIADDLKKISGVGPKLEKTLNGLGIFHFAQIAAFTPENVTWVDRHLRFKGRIEREKWIEQARTLAAGDATEFSRRN